MLNENLWEFPDSAGADEGTDFSKKGRNQGNIIIVDDDADLVTLLQDFLAEKGYAVRGFTSGREALEVVKISPVDLVISDLSMPEMDGIQLVKAAVEINPQLVCIIMTGCTTVKNAMEAMKAGAFDYLMKPFDLGMLLGVLSHAMEVRQLKK